MTPEDVRQEEVFDIIKKVVDDNIIRIKPIDITIQEFYYDEYREKPVENLKLWVDFEFSVENLMEGENTRLCASSKGSGFVHAMVNGLIREFGEHGFTSIKDFKFASFISEAKIDRKYDDIDENRSDAVVKTTLGIFNVRQDVLYFKNESRSSVKAAMLSVVDAFEYLLNSERAIEKLHGSIEYARKNHRPDTVESCINKLSYLTSVNDYQSLIKELNSKDKIDE